MMATYAILDGPDGNVIDRIVADEAFVSARYPHYRLVPDTPPPAQWKITRLAFKRRFPRAKWKKARAASKQSDDLFDFFESWEMALAIDLQDAETIAGITGLVGIPSDFGLTQAEADAVLLVPAAEHEKP